jgi:hypothetical protein
MVDRTHAERQRRYIARLRARAGVSDAAAGAHAALVQELTAAKARIAELETAATAAAAEVAALTVELACERLRRDETKPADPEAEAAARKAAAFAAWAAAPLERR